MSSLTKARELRQERAKLFEDAKADLDANPSGFADPQEKERWDARMADMDSLKQQIDEIEARYEQMKAVEEDMAVRQHALDHVKQFGAKRESAEGNADEYRQAFRSYLKGDMNLKELRALASQTKGTAAAGGNTVPVDMENSVMAAMKEFGGMRQIARVISTPNGRNLDFPTSDDTGNLAKIVAEATALSNSTRVPFGKITMEAVKYYTGPIKISRELIQDSVIDVEAFVRDRMAERFARATNAHYTTRSSTETSGPHGVTNYSTGAVAVANNALTPENLLSLLHSVDPAYRRGPGVAWMTADAGVNEIRALRWGSSRSFVWQPSLQPGVPDSLLGYPIVVNQDTPLEGTSGNKWLWFGNWQHYVIRDVQGIDLMRLEERYAEEDVVAYVGYLRTDGRQVTGSTVAALRPFRAIIQSTG